MKGSAPFQRLVSKPISDGEAMNDPKFQIADASTLAILLSKSLITIDIQAAEIQRLQAEVEQGKKDNVADDSVESMAQGSGSN